MELGGYAQTVSKITDIANIVSGQKYYIGATTGTTDYYLKLASTSLSASVKGNGVTDKTDANVFVFDGSGTSWTIKIDGTDYYLSLKNEKDNGKVQVVNSSVTFTLSNQKEKKLIRISKGEYSIQKNSLSSTNFGSYKNTQTDVWLEPVETSSDKTATKLTFSQSSISFATTDDLSSFTGQTATLAAGDETLTGKTITYKATGDNLFSSFDESTGVLALNGNAGTATVKATFAGDDTYASTTASYTISVRKIYGSLAELKKDIDNTEKEFSLNLKDAVVSYVNATSDQTNVYIEDASAGILVYFAKQLVSDFKVGDKLNGEVSIKATTYRNLNEITSWSPTSSYTVVDGADIPLTTVTIEELVANYDKYESRRVKVENVTVTKGTTGAKQSGEISQNGSSITLRTNAEITTTKDDVIDVIGYPGIYNTGKQFNVWSQDDIIVKGETSGTLNFVAQNGDGYYATFSSDKDVVFTNDVVVSGVSVASGKLSLNDLTADIYEVTDATAGEDKDGAVEGYYVPANTGVLVNSMDATATYYFPKDAQTVTLPANQLKAAPAKGGEFTAEDGYKYYKLAYDNYTNKTGLGFYWGAENGGAFSVKVGTAYLAVPTAETNSAKSFAFNGGTTGIDNVNVDDNQTKVIYNLNGQRVESMSQAGLYIVNGKKVVVRK